MFDVFNRARRLRICAVCPRRRIGLKRKVQGRIRVHRLLVRRMLMAKGCRGRKLLQSGCGRSIHMLLQLIALHGLAMVQASI